MKKTINVAIGGCSFIIDEDAYDTLNDYLEDFRRNSAPDSTGTKMMDDLEDRIADMLKARLEGRDVVSKTMVDDVTGQLGYLGRQSGSQGQTDNGDGSYCYSGSDGERPARKLFRDPDGKKLAGVCSGLALFLGVDVTLIRIIFLVAFICGSAGLWIYLVIWIAAPEARTPEEKCELRGIPANSENRRRFSKEGK